MGLEPGISMMVRDAGRRAEMRGTTPEGSGRNPREYGAGASNITARMESSHPETSGLMDAVVECEKLATLLDQP